MVSSSYAILLRKSLISLLSLLLFKCCVTLDLAPCHQSEVTWSSHLLLLPILILRLGLVRSTEYSKMTVYVYEVRSPHIYEHFIVQDIISCSSSAVVRAVACRSESHWFDFVLARNVLGSTSTEVNPASTKGHLGFP